MTWRREHQLLLIGRWVTCIYTHILSLTSSLKENCLCYPTIFALAMDILPIQGSLVPCKRVFSSAKETMTDHRNHISPELIEDLQLLKYTVKHGHSINFSAGNSWEEERAAIEMLMQIDSKVPKNLKAYQEFLACPRVQQDDSDVEST